MEQYQRILEDNTPSVLAINFVHNTPCIETKEVLVLIINMKQKSMSFLN